MHCWNLKFVFLQSSWILSISEGLHISSILMKALSVFRATWDAINQNMVSRSYKYVTYFNPLAWHLTPVQFFYILQEARVAIEQVVIPKGKPVELLPRPSPIITLQVDLIQKYQLRSETVGQEPEDRLRILPFQAGIDD